MQNKDIKLVMWQLGNRLVDDRRGYFEYIWNQFSWFFFQFSTFIHVFDYSSGICQTQDWIFCPESDITRGLIKSTHVCRSSVQIKRKGGINRPRDARSNSSTLRQEINRGRECPDARETRCYFPSVLLLYYTDPNSANPPRLPTPT